MQRLLVVLIIFLVSGELCLAQSIVYKTLYSFKSVSDGASPFGGVTLGAKGVLYGTTLKGGAFGVGTAYKLVPSGISWVESVIHSFDWQNGTSGNDGAYPNASLTIGDSQVLYGTARGGGTPCCSAAGAVFKLTPSVAGQWTETTLYPFQPGSPNSQNHTPWSPVLIGPDGTLYTTAITGDVVAVSPPAEVGGDWVGKVIASVGLYPQGALLFANGKIFGTTEYGGLVKCSSGYCGGTAFELTPPIGPGGSWNVTTIHEFGSFPPDGDGPVGGLTLGRDGSLYGTTFNGGSGVPCSFPPYLVSGCGTVFQLKPPSAPSGAWTETVLYSFTGENGDGAYPSGSLAMDQTGALYGTTQYGGSAGSCNFYGVTGCGTAFWLGPPAQPGGAWTKTLLHNFSGQSDDGAVPIAGLIASPSGEFYGTASGGGLGQAGVVFVLAPK